ncbi:unnamed protein product [Mycena citricolor]|uniref:Phosducin domain-containing protein n=1 Tax=Mycena citricolor TaxID=2018698 RepID=A0AAD2K6K8_9AGAR|nr:unnamed protein product [Mycena citricolor]
MAELEQLILSGQLFGNAERSSSPVRTPSPDTGWHDDELNLSDAEKDYDSDTARRAAFDKQLKDQERQQESIGMGPGRTGVKGVIRDRDEAEELERQKRARELNAIGQRMERTNLGGKTYLEEEREKGDDADELVLKERQRTEDRKNVFGQARQGKFGHLREVGVKGFLPAVEGESRGTWVVVHLYDPSLDRCYMLDDTLARLARAYADTKFLRARASALGFASTSSSSRSKAPVHRPVRSQVSTDDDFDEKDDDEDYDDNAEDVYEDDDVDVDVLPTMLVYRDGELVHNWVRVDWEAGTAGIEDLLDRHHILPQSSINSRNLGLPSDDEDDLIWSDDENGLV